MTHLSCTELAVGHAGLAVASGISCTVGAGDLVCAVGENGTGKSTFVKTIIGLIPPVSGSFELCTGAVGYVPQRAEVKGDFPASAAEVALSGRVVHLGLRPFLGKRDREIARAALARAGAQDLAERPFSTLSGGQQQRVLLARALATDARLLVLDEPTTGLDPEAAASLYQVLDELRDEGRGILAVTHDVAEARRHATHLLSFELGRTPRFEALPSKSTGLDAEGEASPHGRDAEAPPAPGGGRSADAPSASDRSKEVVA